MDSTIRHAARPSVRKDRGPFLFARSYACLLPFTIFSGAIGESLLVSIKDAAPREPARRVRVARAPSRRGFGREAADRWPLHPRSFALDGITRGAGVRVGFRRLLA